MLGTFPLPCLFGVCGRRRRRRPGMGWEAPDAVPRAGGNRLFGELVTPPCPPPLPLAGSRGSCGSRTVPVPSAMARARQAVRRRERGGRLGVPARCPQGVGGSRSLAPGPGCRALMALAAAKSQIRISSGWGGGNWPLPAAAAALPTAPPAMCRAGGGPAPLHPGGVCPELCPSIHPSLHRSSSSSPKRGGYPQHHPGRGVLGLCVCPPPPHPTPPHPPGQEKSQTRTTLALSRRARERAGDLPARAAGEIGGCHGERGCHRGGGRLPVPDKVSPHPPDPGGDRSRAGCAAPAPLGLRHRIRAPGSGLFFLFPRQHPHPPVPAPTLPFAVSSIRSPPSP